MAFMNNGAGTSVPLNNNKTSGAGTSVPLNTMLKDETKVSTPQKNDDETKVSIPKKNYNGTEVPAPEVSIVKKDVKHINLNLKLIKKATECIEYVVFHELAHLVYADHSAKFYNYLTLFIGDWEKRKERLEK